MLQQLFVCTISDIASVIAPYQATGPEQLSLSPGQLISVRKKSPSGWWEGELQVIRAWPAMLSDTIFINNFHSVKELRPSHSNSCEDLLVAPFESYYVKGNINTLIQDIGAQK